MIKLCEKKNMCAYIINFSLFLRAEQCRPFFFLLANKFSPPGYENCFLNYTTKHICCHPLRELDHINNNTLFLYLNYLFKPAAATTYSKNSLHVMSRKLLYLCSCCSCHVLVSESTMRHTLLFECMHLRTTYVRM